MSAIEISGGRAAVTFARPFDLESYRLFLRAKALPERELVYDWRSDTYTLSTSARYAAVLDGSAAGTAGTDVALADHLFDYQRWIVGLALDARRFAIWADTGLGKTAMFLEWARAVAFLTSGPVLILSPLQVIEQTRAEWERFYPNLEPIERLDSREALAAWCSQPDGPGRLAITNPEKLTAGQLPELRGLAGLVVDESSFLKSGGGTIKWNLIHSAKGIAYKLSCTATPAPNDTMEYASQAAFLEVLRNEGEILWTYFTRDKRGKWLVKPHAREAFYRFMSAWSIYLRDPAAYGFDDILSTLPPPVIHEHRIDVTSEQRERMQELMAHAGRGLFDERQGMRERSKLSQLAKGFMYGPGSGSGRKVVRVESLKPARVAELVRAEVAAGRPTIVWTVFDEESEILAGELHSVPYAMLHGSDPVEARESALRSFREGRVEALISKASLIGFGLNLQMCRAMVFSGFDDSFERLYQAIRRAYRFGQTETVHVHVPLVPELEGLMLDNLKRKQALFDGDVAVQEANYRAALADALPTTKEAV